MNHFWAYWRSAWEIFQELAPWLLFGKEFGRRVTLTYLLVIAAGSVFFGWLFELLIGDYFRPRQAATAHLEETGLVGALILLAVFAWFAVRDLRFWHRRGNKPLILTNLH